MIGHSYDKVVPISVSDEFGILWFLGESVRGGWGGKGGVQTRLRPLGAQPCSIRTQEIGILTLQPGPGLKVRFTLTTLPPTFLGVCGCTDFGVQLNSTIPK
jgi:hypothetical protein